MFALNHQSWLDSWISQPSPWTRNLVHIPIPPPLPPPHLPGPYQTVKFWCPHRRLMSHGLDSHALDASTPVALPTYPRGRLLQGSPPSLFLLLHVFQPFCNLLPVLVHRSFSSILSTLSSFSPNPQHLHFQRIILLSTLRGNESHWVEAPWASSPAPKPETPVLS